MPWVCWSRSAWAMCRPNWVVIPTTRFGCGLRGTSADVRLPGGMAVTRQVMDARLVEAAVGEGVTFLPSTQAELTAPTRHEREFRLRQPDAEATLATKLVIAADGITGNAA